VHTPTVSTVSNCPDVIFHLHICFSPTVTPQLVLLHLLLTHGLKIQELQIIYLKTKVYCHLLTTIFSSISDISRWFYIFCTRYRRC